MYVTLADDRDRPLSILFKVSIFFCTRQSRSYTFNPSGLRVPARPKRRPVLKEPGLADRRFVRNDRAKLVDRYPNRHYRFFGPTIEMESRDNTARVRYVFSYSYAGIKSAAGTCHVSLTVERIAAAARVVLPRTGTAT